MASISFRFALFLMHARLFSTESHQNTMGKSQSRIDPGPGAVAELSVPPRKSLNRLRVRADELCLEDANVASLLTQAEGRRLIKLNNCVLDSAWGETLALSASLQVLIVRDDAYRLAGRRQLNWQSFFDHYDSSTSALQELRVTSCLIMPRLLQSGMLGHLNSLDLVNMNLSNLDDLVAALKGNLNLRNLSLAQNELGNDAILALSPLTSVLRRINLSGNDFDGDAEWTWLLRSGGPLVALNLGNCPLFRCGRLGSSFKESLVYCHLTDVSLSNLPHLKGLSGICFEALIAQPSMQKLDISKSDLGNDEATHIALGLARSHSLKWLNISSNAFTKKGAVEIFSILEEKNLTLEYFNISRNALGGADAEIGKALERFLRKSCLKKLVCKSIKLEEADWEYIAAGLRNNGRLRVLLATQNKAYRNMESICQWFGAALPFCSLSRLGIANEDEPTYFHSEEGARAILTALHLNHSLIDLEGSSQNLQVRKILDRNLNSRQRVEDIVVLLLLARRFGDWSIPREIATKIALAVHETRGDPVWCGNVI